MKKIRKAEFLAAVAIITSATVMQIREHMQPHEAPAATAKATQLSCDMPRSGLVLAACEPTRGEAPAKKDRATRHWRGMSKLWV